MACRTAAVRHRSRKEALGMSLTYDCTDPVQRRLGVEAAVDVVRSGELVVLPTDTVYGVGADAFSPAAVGRLLVAKGRGRDMPVPVLIGSVSTLDGIATGISTAARELVDAFWPGGLTVVCQQQPSLIWDLGETRGTVAVRMPEHPVAIELLTETGPLAVSSANVSGRPPAANVTEAEQQLGESVAVYLDGGPSGEPIPSTIVDLTGDQPHVLRAGAISLDELRAIVPDVGVAA
jgi:tRNA threonylcarbamoyl adenosine modification protein (Sua5/YciO/YrdC/YwlC family)